MVVTFLPSLQHLAAVRVALTVYNDVIIDLLKDLCIINYLDGRKTVDIGSVEFETWLRKTKQKPSGGLSKVLPPSIEKRVLNILRPIVIETIHWIRDHAFILEHFNESERVNILCWRLEGTINRRETVKQIMQNESIAKEVRLYLACIYFLDHSVKQLWQSMTEPERQSMLGLDLNEAVHFWKSLMLQSNELKWTEFVALYFDKSLLCYLPFDPLRNKKYRIRLSSFFIYLLKDYKHFYLNPSNSIPVHSDDLRQCLGLMDFHELAEVVNEQAKVLTFYLDWPLQSQFLHVVDEIGSRLNASAFETFLLYILLEKLVPAVDDFDYLQLFNDLWDKIPDAHKDVIKGGKHFPFVQAALKCDEKTQLRPIIEILSIFT